MSEYIRSVEAERIAVSKMESAVPQGKRKKKLKYQDRYAIAGFIFALPFLIGFAIFKLAPLVVSIQMSFSNITNTVSASMQWIGWYNYQALFTDQTGRLVSTLVSYCTSTLLQLPVINISAFFFAILLNRKMAGQATYRAIFFIPVLIGSGYAYDVLSGYIQQGMNITIPGGLIYYMGGTDLVTYIMDFFNTFVSTLWKTGVQVLLYLTGLQGISKSLYESAYCDGATEWEQFWKITLPMMTPTILLCLIYTLIIRFNDVENPFSSYYISSTNAENVPLTGYPGFLAGVSWVYAIVSLLWIGLILLIMNPIVKKNSGRD